MYYLQTKNLVFSEDRSIIPISFICQWDSLVNETLTNKSHWQINLILKIIFYTSAITRNQVFSGMPLNLKLVSATFYQISIFYQMIALQKLWKMFFISPKKLFSFLRYSSSCIFVFPFFSLSAFALEVDPRKVLKFMTSSTI